MGTPKTGSKKEAEDASSKSKDKEKIIEKESKTKAKAQKAHKPAEQKKSQILDVAPGVEGMTAPPADVGQPEDEDEEPHYNPWRRVAAARARQSAEKATKPSGTRRARPETTRSAKGSGKSRQPKQAGKSAAGASRRKSSPKRDRKSGVKSKQRSRSRTPDDGDDDEDEEKPTTEVKQFAFPHYKILSGASVAPVRMLPQKIVIKPSCEPDESRPRQWAAGLFQNTKLSVKLRLLRLFLVWLFFRMLNRQAMWLSEKLDLGQPDPADVQKPPPSGPGEKYIRVFHEGTPNPFHMKFTPGMNPADGFRPPPFK